MKNHAALIMALFVCSCAPMPLSSTDSEPSSFSSAVLSDESSKADNAFEKYIIEEKTFFAFEICSTEATLSEGRNKFSDIYFDFIKGDYCYDVSSSDKTNDFDLFESHVAVSGGPIQEGHHLDKVNRSSQVFVSLFKGAADYPREIYIDVISYSKNDLTEICGFASLVVHPDSAYEKTDSDDEHESGYISWKLDLVFSYSFPQIEGEPQKVSKNDIDYTFEEAHKKSVGSFFKAV